MADKRHAPEQVKRLIAMANSVPAEVELASVSGNQDKIWKTLRSSPLFRQFRVLAHVPKPGTAVPRIARVFVMAAYTRLQATRELLRAIAQRKGTKVPPTLMQIVPVINDRGRIHFSIGDVIDPLEGIEADRIRQCPICEKIFWAARRDQCCCERKCARTLRTRRWRRRYLPHYKLRRLGKIDDR
jgi:hypothetical protein